MNPDEIDKLVKNNLENVKNIQGFEKVRFIMLYGSSVEGITREESLGLLKDGMYKRIEFCIQNVFDICAIINTDLRLGIPRSDDDIHGILLRNRVIDEEMMAKLKGMKGFRNIIVNRYAGFDDRLSYEFLSERLEDFEEFIGKITDFIRMQNK